VRCGQLSNGLRFYTQNDSASTRELAVIAIMAGSFHDPPNRRGLAHVVEHVVCDRSKTYDRESAWRLKSRITGDPDETIYITTDETATTYGPSDAVKKRFGRKLFGMYAEMVSDPLVTSEILAKEKAAVHQEYFLRKELICCLFDSLRKMVFPKRFLARLPIDGFMSQVFKITISDVKQFLEKYYVPHNAFVVFLGPKFNEVETVVSDELGNWGINWSKKRNRGAQFTFRQGLGGFKPLTSSKVRIVKLPRLHQHHTAIGFPTDTYQNEDAEALDVLARILSDRMYYELRDKNFDWNKGAYRTPVFAERTYMYGLFTFHFATTSKEFAKHGRRVLHDQCRRLCDDLVGKSELETWLGYELDAYFKDAFERAPSSLMELVVKAVSNGDLDLTRLHSRGDRLLSLLKRGGRQRLREVARKYLSGHSATVILQPA